MGWHERFADFKKNLTMIGVRLPGQEFVRTVPYSIEHSGQIFVSEYRGADLRIWPIEEYLARRKHSPPVAARIKRLNPNGKEEMTRPRGWHPWRLSKRRRKKKFANGT